MRTSMAYFAGAGTVVVAIAAGLGGGLVIADVMNPHATKVVSKVEHQAEARQQAAQQSPQPNAAQQSPQPDAAQASPQPQPSPSTASNAPQQPAPYLAQVQPAAKTPVVVGAAPQKPQEKAPEKPQDQPKSETAKASDPPAKNDVAAAKPDDSTKAKRDDTKRDDTPKPKQAEQTPSQSMPHEEAAAPDSAYAKARDADLKRSDDKRKSDRHQWASRHQQPRDRDQDMRDVEEQVRRDSGPREVYVERDDSDGPAYDRNRRNYDRPDHDRPMRFDFPRMNFFGPDD